MQSAAQETRYFSALMAEAGRASLMCINRGTSITTASALCVRFCQGFAILFCGQRRRNNGACPVLAAKTPEAEKSAWQPVDCFPKLGVIMADPRRQTFALFGHTLIMLFAGYMSIFNALGFPWCRVLVIRKTANWNRRYGSAITLGFAYIYQSMNHKRLLCVIKVKFYRF
jgi:hypothetical protein